jgi:thiamine pyrophosphate-dependent acetolactate synthase large subunit-like protein
MKNRRDFIKYVAVTGAASGIAASGFAESKSDKEKTKSHGEEPSSAVPPSSHAEAMEKEPLLDGYSKSQLDRYFVRRAGSDFMTDVIKRLDLDYMAANPGSSFRGLQESVVAYGGNHSPHWLTCLHEESAVAMAHGYSKIAYKPMGVACHGTVGLQHASMAVYNAFCDRAPVIIFAGNHLDATTRRLNTEWTHSVQDTAKLVRDFIKWDDTPVSLGHFAESVIRAYKIATTPPMGPVVITIDGHLQEKEIAGLNFSIPALTTVVPPQGDSGALQRAADLLVNAERPVILADYMARTPEGVQGLIELAEALQVPVVDRGGRMNFPNDHPLNQTGAGSRFIREADVILGLEMYDFYGEIHRVRDLVHREAERVARPDVTLISLGVNDLFLKSNYQYFQRYQPVDLAIAADAQTSLPALTEAIRRSLPASHRSRLDERAKSLHKAHQQTREEARQAAVYGWNSTPVTLARLHMELWQQIRDRDWSLLSHGDRWTRDLWSINRHHQYIGSSGGGGQGYEAPAAAGAALANQAHGRLSVNIQPDGDLMYAPGVLWTMAHHKIPLLSIMHNNRAYQREVMHLQQMASRRCRGMDGLAEVGNVMKRPNIDFAHLAQSMGVWAEGPITDPDDLAPAIKRAIEIVEQGEPALIDVFCQPR